MKHNYSNNPNIYYSQNNEDKYIYEKYFKHINIKNGIYFEAGALNGVHDSNTKFFEDTLQWTGILVEPNPYQFSLLEKSRKNNILINNVISNISDTLEFHYSEKFNAPISGLAITLPKSHYDDYFSKIEMKSAYFTPISLNEIIEKNNIKHIHFFSLDVEGHEYNVLLSYNFSIPIYLMMIENLEKKNDCKDLLEKNGYLYVDKIGVNDIFIQTKYINIFFNKPFYYF